MLSYRINITNISAYKYIKLLNVMFIFTVNCGMQYERLLAAWRFFLGRGGQAY